MRAVHASVHVAPLRSAFSHGDHGLLKFLTIIIIKTGQGRHVWPQEDPEHLLLDHDHVRTLKILQSTSALGGLRKHKKTQHALFTDRRINVLLYSK